jgi:hypothetical protein
MISRIQNVPNTISYFRFSATIVRKGYILVVLFQGGERILKIKGMSILEVGADENVTLWVYGEIRNDHHLNDLQVCRKSAPLMNVLIILMIILKQGGGKHIALTKRVLLCTR